MSLSDKQSDTTMSSVSLNFAHVFVDVLTCPGKAFKDICTDPRQLSLPATIALVLIVSIIEGLQTIHFLSPAQLYVSALASGFFGLFRWILLVTSFSLAALCFAVHKSRIYAFLVASAWAQLPLLFLAPLACYRHLLGHTYFLAVACLYVWLFCLEWLAIETSFGLKQLEVFCLIITVPALIGLCQIAWLYPVIAETFKWIAS